MNHELSAAEQALLADQPLLDKIKGAWSAVIGAETTAETAKANLVSHSRALGELLIQAKRRHPAVKDFEAFLKRVDGLKLSRAYDLMRLAGGRITDEKLREEARDRQRKSRAKKKVLPPVKPITAEPEPTFRDKPHVTESLTIPIEQRKADMAALDLNADEGGAKASATALQEFKYYCRVWLPKITAEADRQKARQYVVELTSAPKAEAA
jgi:hypothetical protein